MNTDVLIAALSVTLEILFLGISFLCKEHRKHPIFVFYIFWTVVSDLAYELFVRSVPRYALKLYVAELAIDAVFQVLVIGEIVWTTLRPVRTSLPRHWYWVAVAGFVLLACGFWPLAGFAIPPNLTPASNAMILLQQTISLLRVTFFLVLVAFSQFLSIGWRDRELQIASGLGFYSILSLVVSVLHTHQAVGPQYHWLDLVTSFGYLGTLAYWVVCFMQKEPETRKISPQMVRFLVSIGGTVQAEQLALETVLKKKPGGHSHL